MTRQELSNVLKKLDLLGSSVFTLQDIQLFFPNEQTSTVKASLKRHCEAGLIQRACRGVYVNLNARSKDGYILEHIAKSLRRGHYSYVSLESRLSELGVISQIPFCLLTVMTTGRKQRYKTPYGGIEFTHTSKTIEQILRDTYNEESRPLRVAKKEAALLDLKHVNRNMGLIDPEEL